MLNKDNIDLKIILSFTNAYQELYEKGEITAEELDKVLSLLDHYQDYPVKTFQQKLTDIFN